MLATSFFITVGDMEALEVLGFLIHGMKFVLGMSPIMALPFDFGFCVEGARVSKAASMIDLGDPLERRIDGGTGRFEESVGNGPATAVVILTMVAATAMSIARAGEDDISARLFATPEERVQRGGTGRFDKLLGGQSPAMLP